MSTISVCVSKQRLVEAARPSTHSSRLTWDHLGEVAMSYEGSLVHRQHPHKGIGLGGDRDVHLPSCVHHIHVNCHLQHHTTITTHTTTPHLDTTLLTH